MSLLAVGVAFNKVCFLGAGLTTVTLDGISKNGGAFAPPSGGAVTDLGNGWYKAVLDATDTNTAGDLALHFAAVAGTPVDPPPDQVSATVTLSVATLAAIVAQTLTETYNVAGAAPTLQQALFVIMQRLTNFTKSGTTVSVKKLDGTTQAYPLTLDSASVPTSSVRTV